MILKPETRLKRIAAILEDVDARCIAVDGPVTDTREEMTKAELREIYILAEKPPDYSFRRLKHGNYAVKEGDEE